MRKLLVVFLFSLCGFASAQSTTVSVTVVDQTAQAWANGTISYIFSPTPGIPGPFYWGGATVPAQYLTPTIIALDGSGSASFSVPTSTAITPSGSGWLYNVCPNASAKCVQLIISATGSTQNISAAITAVLSALQVNAANLPKAYSDSEVVTVPAQGGTYYNTSIPAPRYFDGSAWHTFGGGVTPSDVVVTDPTGSQNITQPNGTALSVNGLPVVAGTASWPGLTSFGDSICNYTGSTSNATAFISLLANQTGGMLNNTCISGYWIQDEPLEMYLAGTAGWNGSVVGQPTQANNPLNLEEGGRNDADTCNGNANCDATSGLALNTIIAHRGSNNWVPVSSCSQTGTWSNDSVLVNPANGVQALAATTVGASLTCTVTTYGNNGAIQVPVRGITSNSATATVVIDGGSPTTIIATGVGGTSIIGGSRTTVLGYMFPVAAGTHTVVITTATGTSSGNPISIPDLVGNPNPANQYTSPPFIGVMEVAPEQNNINPTWTTSINATKQAAVTAMQGYGYNVQWLPITNVPCTNGVSGCLGGFNNATYISNQPSANDPDGLSCAGSTSDSVHPNNCGHKQVFQALQKDLNIVQASASSPLSSWCVANPSLVVIATTSYNAVTNQCTIFSNSSAGVFLPTLPTGQHIRVVNINSTGGASVPIYTAIGLANPIPPGFAETFDNYGANWYWTGGMPYEIPGNFTAHGLLEAVGGIYAGSALQFQVSGSGVASMGAGSTASNGTSQQAICLADGTGCLGSAHSDYAHIEGTLFATNTMLGPVFAEPLQVHFKTLIVRLSGTLSCSSAPVVSMMDLGTSPSTVYGGAIGIVAAVTTATSDGVYKLSTSVNMTPGDYYGFAFTGGTCVTAPTFDITAQVQ